ncbi:MAG: carotenoid oxygenase family protein [Actinobacteria bacterium]|nr:carotenoid oxygenase family protein [Actinomycetota bacterium]
MSTTTPAPPFHLTGGYAPVVDETTTTDLAITGRLPEALAGSFLRTGPNPRSGSSPHWFLGDGMVHGVRLEGGRAVGYRNRYVRTASFEGRASTFDQEGRRDLTASTANTHVIRHAGRILALEEAGLPYELTDDLDTVGPVDFGGRLATAMTAHPKICPTTGELHGFGYGWAPPFLTYHVVDATGRLTVSREVEVPGPTMAHDFNLTERFVVFMDLPAVFDLERAMQGTMPYRWDPSYGARLGVLRRDDPHGEVRWFEVEPCYVFHPVNAHDDGRTITIDVVRHPELWVADAAPATLWRWQIDLVTGAVTERQLDDRPCEFPRVDDRLVGMDARVAWTTTMPRPETPTSSGAITVHDLHGETSVTHELAPGRIPGEAVFAPADDRPGGPGWLLAYVHDAVRGASDVIVLDVEHPADDPVAVVGLPVRVPRGFHGSWLAD